jgi:undecaprenyl-diphosphatase
MNTLTSFDLRVFEWLRAWHAPWLDAAFTWFDSHGGGGLIWFTLLLASFVRGQDRAAAWRVLLTVALAYAVAGLVLKPMIDRPRPSPHTVTAAASGQPTPFDAAPRTLPDIPSSPSFPSDRSAAAFGAAVAVSRMWPGTTALWWTSAVLIAYGRVYVGHHYPLDVVGGAAVGMTVALWVLGGRHRATYAQTLPRPLPRGVMVTP